MKKKISILLLIIFALPLLAFMGCGRTTYYNVTLSYSGTGHIDPPQTSYASGSTVKFVASGNVVAWVYQNSTLLPDDSTYSIKTTKEEGVVTKSELSFKATESTKGAYTAVFADKKMPYAKLTSLRLTTDIDAEPVQDSPSKQPILTASFAVSQGINELETAANFKEIALKDNVEVATEDVNKLIKLDPESYTQISVNDINFAKEATSASFSQFRTTLLLQKDTERTEQTNYSQYAEYAEGTYKIVFEFKFSGTTYFLVLNYTELT